MWESSYWLGKNIARSTGYKNSRKAWMGALASVTKLPWSSMKAPRSVKKLQLSMTKTLFCDETMRLCDESTVLCHEIPTVVRGYESTTLWRKHRVLWRYITLWRKQCGFCRTYHSIWRKPLCSVAKIYHALWWVFNIRNGLVKSSYMILKSNFNSSPKYWMNHIKLSLPAFFII